MVPLSIKPALGQVSEYGSEPHRLGWVDTQLRSSSWAKAEEAGHVLEHDPGGPDPGDDGPDIWPQPPFVVGSAPFSCEAGWLARKPRRDEVDPGPFGPVEPPVGGGAHIVMFRYLQPVLFQYAPAEVVDLDLADDSHSRPLQPEV